MQKPLPLIITLNGKLHDISNFSSKHPGGEKVLKEVSGAEVSSIMLGKESILGVRHEHSDAAYKILEKYSLHGGSMNTDPIVDSNSPVIWKVGTLKEEYWPWIHRPYEGTLRLFEMKILETLTRTKWWLVPLIWMPVVIYFGLSGTTSLMESYGGTKGSLLSAGLFLCGCLAWTLLEYSLHRCLFHWRPNLRSHTQITFHFLLHGLHHKTPLDPDRLVFPPAAALLIITLFYTAYRIFLPFPIFCCYACGKLFGYICYDMTHYYLHHGSPNPSSTLYYKKIYHYNHHFKDSTSGYGISTMLWDYVFGTIGSGPLII